MPTPPMTAEPYFWAKNVVLPVTLTLATGLASYFAKRGFAAIRFGLHRARLTRAEKQLEFATKLHNDPKLAQLWMTFQAVHAAPFVASSAFGAVLFGHAMFSKGEAMDVATMVLATSIMGISMGQLVILWTDAAFALLAATRFDTVEVRLQRLIARLSK